MRTLRATYTLVVDIEPCGLDDDEAERQRVMDMVFEEPAAYVRDDNVTVTVEWVDV